MDWKKVDPVLEPPAPGLLTGTTYLDKAPAPANKVVPVWEQWIVLAVLVVMLAGIITFARLKRDFLSDPRDKEEGFPRDLR